MDKDYTKQLSVFLMKVLINYYTSIIVPLLVFNTVIFYEQITLIQRAIWFDQLPSLLNDLVCMRIFELASKLRSLELLEQFLVSNTIERVITR